MLKKMHRPQDWSSNRSATPQPKRSCPRDNRKRRLAPAGDQSFSLRRSRCHQNSAIRLNGISEPNASGSRTSNSQVAKKPAGPYRQVLL
jgi:hypothetical protein